MQIKKAVLTIFLALIVTSTLLLSQNHYVYAATVFVDDYETADFKLYVKSIGKDNVLKVPARLEYKDATNKDYSQDIVLELTAYSPKMRGMAGGSSISIIIILVILMVAGWFIYKRWEKKKKAKKTSKENKESKESKK